LTDEGTGRCVRRRQHPCLADQIGKFDLAPHRGCPDHSNTRDRLKPLAQSGRDFAAWIGLTPRQDSTGGKQKLGPISKQGDPYLRRILVVGAHAVLRRAMQQPEKYPWLTQLLARRPFKVVAVALANKMARTAWALLTHGGTYRAPELVAAA
jgi:Transposase IS116/IS110/IS902 family